MFVVIAEWTLEEITGGQGQRAEATSVEDAAAAVGLHGVTGESEHVPTDHTRIILEIPVTEHIVTVFVAEGVKSA